MIHTYGISFNFSFKFKDRIESISDRISQIQNISKYFGSSPFLTPDKKVLVFQKNSNQLIIASNELQIGSNIGVTARYETFGEPLIIDKVANAVHECCDVVKEELSIKLERIGSVNHFIGNTLEKDSNELLKRNFIRNFLNDAGTFSGGEYKFLYRDKPVEIGKQLNINISILASTEQKNSLNIILDINNFELFDDENGLDNISRIGKYSFDFLNDKLAPTLKDIGINLIGYEQ